MSHALAYGVADTSHQAGGSDALQRGRQLRPRQAGLL